GTRASGCARHHPSASPTHRLRKHGYAHPGPNDDPDDDNHQSADRRSNDCCPNDHDARSDIRQLLGPPRRLFTLIQLRSPHGGPVELYINHGQAERDSTVVILRRPDDSERVPSIHDQLVCERPSWLRPRPLSRELHDDRQPGTETPVPLHDQHRAPSVELQPRHLGKHGRHRGVLPQSEPHLVVGRHRVHGRGERLLLREPRHPHTRLLVEGRIDQGRKRPRQDHLVVLSQPRELGGARPVLGVCQRYRSAIERQLGRDSSPGGRQVVQGDYELGQARRLHPQLGGPW
ncbi:hypothetical protein H310_12182, partial [Aphanomyces invadans]